MTETPATVMMLARVSIAVAAALAKDTLFRRLLAAASGKELAANALGVALAVIAVAALVAVIRRPS